MIQLIMEIQSYPTAKSTKTLLDKAFCTMLQPPYILFEDQQVQRHLSVMPTDKK